MEKTKDGRKPKRFRLSRSKGWRMPEGSVKVDRSTRWGNHFVVLSGWREGTSRYGKNLIPVSTAAEAAAMFEKYLRGDPMLMEQVRTALRGRDVGCWCELGAPCHGDILVKVANETSA